MLVFAHPFCAASLNASRGPAPGVLAILVGAFVIGLPLGCTDRSEAQMSPSDIDAYVHAMMPRKIQVQPSLTKPVSYNGSGDADGLEVILAALDKMNDETKVVGTFQFELHTLRKASSDPLGQRIAFWPVEIKSDDSFLRYWDRLARFYRFPLKLDSGPLTPGQYILSARLRLPTGDTLFDQYEFTHEGGAVPIVSSGK